MQSATMIATPNSILIDLSALAGNLRQVRNLVGTNTRIMGVVKSDAYGHGLLEVGRALERNAIDCLGVAYLHEALVLRPLVCDFSATCGEVGALLVKAFEVSAWGSLSKSCIKMGP